MSASGFPLGVEIEIPGRSDDANITWWAECDCDHSMPHGKYGIKKIKLYEPPPPVLTQAAMPFAGIQTRGVSMDEALLDPRFEEYKTPDARTNLYIPVTQVMAPKKNNARLVKPLSAVF